MEIKSDECGEPLKKKMCFSGDILRGETLSATQVRKQLTSTQC